VVIEILTEEKRRTQVFANNQALLIKEEF